MAVPLLWFLACLLIFHPAVIDTFGWVTQCCAHPGSQQLCSQEEQSHFRKETVLSVSFCSCIYSRWRPRSHLKTGCVRVCPQNAVLSPGHGAARGSKERCTKGIQPRGLSSPPSDRFQYQHSVYRCSRAVSFRVVLKRLIVSSAERFV